MTQAPRQITLNINGMTCDHCAKSTEDALNALPGVNATVSFEKKQANVQLDGQSDFNQLLDTVKSAGFNASFQNKPDDVTKTTSEGNDGLHVVIVGSGSGAFAAAIKAVENGAQVTVIEGGEVIGGTCVNIGCVPSKIMIRGAHIAYLQGHHSVAGLPLNTPAIDRQAMVQQQQEWVSNLRYAKYESILEDNSSINLVRGMARFKNANTLIVKKADGSEREIHADRILLAVGASSAIPDISGLSETPYWTSTEALVAEEIPKHLLVLGSSVIALELAQAFRHLGAEVTIIARSTLLSKEDSEIGESLKQVFEDESIKVLTNSSPEAISHNGSTFVVSLKDKELHGDQLLVATGRQANTATLDLDKVGVETDRQGRIVIDDHMRSSAENIYAAGDCTTQPRYVYVAAAAGTRAARNMTGDDVVIDLSVMPAVVFTTPQVSTVGLTEQHAKQQGLDVESRRLDIENVPRALANFDTRGFIKLVAERDSGRIVGCQILAADAGEIIQTAALAIRNNMTIDDIANQLFPYLTMVEGLKLCAQTFSKDVKQLSCCAG